MTTADMQVPPSVPNLLIRRRRVKLQTALAQPLADFANARFSDTFTRTMLKRATAPPLFGTRGDQFSAARIPAIITLILLFGFFYVQNLHRILGPEHHQADFKHFYAATVAMNHGEPLYKSGTGGYVYPPLLAFLYLPLSHLPDQWAAAVALSFNIPLAIGALLATTLANAQRYARGSVVPNGFIPLIAAIAAIVTFGRLKAEIQMLQTDVLVLAAYAFALYWLDRRPLLAGGVLGFALNIKYYTAPALIYLVLRRRWSAATSFIISAVVFALIPAVKLGMPLNLRYLSIATGGVLRSIGVNVSQDESARIHKVYEDLSVSVTSAIARLVLHTHPSWTMPITACIIAAAVILAAACYRYRRLPFVLWPNALAQRLAPFPALVVLEWAGVMVAAITFSPDSNMRHMVLVLPANILALTLVFSNIPSPRRVLLVIGLALEFIAFDCTRAFPGWTKEAFFHASGQAWSVLIFFALLLWVALAEIRENEPVDVNALR